jgi:uncharacterized protein
MIPQFTAIELRIIGCLLEKSITTPEYYPLTLNSLINACNQKSNRNPVMALTEDDVFGALTTMRENGFLESVYSEGNRSERYRQLFTDPFGFSRPQIAIICELFLRGPQTAGELNSRAGRMASFGSAADVIKVLDSLAAYEAESMVVRLPRKPGQKDNRWTHLFAPIDSPEQEGGGDKAVNESSSPTVLLKSSSDERVVQLENEVSGLKREIKILNERLDGLGRYLDDLARDVKNRQAAPEEE